MAISKTSSSVQRTSSSSSSISKRKAADAELDVGTPLSQQQQQPASKIIVVEATQKQHHHHHNNSSKALMPRARSVPKQQTAFQEHTAQRKKKAATMPLTLASLGPTVASVQGANATIETISPATTSGALDSSQQPSAASAAANPRKRSAEVQTLDGERPKSRPRTSHTQPSKSIRVTAAPVVVDLAVDDAGPQVISLDGSDKESSGRSSAAAPKTSQPAEAPSAPSDPSGELPALPAPLPRSSHSLVGKFLGQEYQLLRLLGQGGAASVYLGQSIKDKSRVAIKVVEKSADDFELKLQQLEMDIHASLKHANIVDFHRLLQDDAHFYLVMELCDQGDLYEFVGHQAVDEEYVRPEEQAVKSMFVQILDSVQHMHAKGVYHRDIKLENVLLKSSPEQDGPVCKVADFGLATRERRSMDFGCGTVLCLAPEHFNPRKQAAPYDAAASDVWSLGVLLLALMFGDGPWEEASLADPDFCLYQRDPTVLQEFYPELSGAAFSLLKSMLAMEEVDRPSVVEIKQQFLAIERLFEEGEDSESA
ncbi:hypothetical protein MBANPS3_009804 [Mucor bainieri]